MRKIIRNGAIIEDDWLHLEDAEPLPAAGKIIVSLDRWQHQRPVLLDSACAIGVRLSAEQALDDLVADLPHFQLIALEFSVFRDGRSLSLARILREQLGYAGELRAVGDVLQDQMFYMQRVGINAFEPRADRCLEQALASLQGFSAAYQPAADGLTLVWRRRQGVSS